MLILSKSRNKISEGQTVTYNVGGKLKKYKKVNGKMKYIGAADAPAKKKLVIKKKEEKKEVKRSALQQRVWDELKINCKDEAGAKYVESELYKFKRAHREELQPDDYKLPDYIRNIYIFGSTQNKFGINKMDIEMPRMLEHKEKDGIDYFKGVSKEIKDAIKPSLDYHKKDMISVQRNRDKEKVKRRTQAANAKLYRRQESILGPYKKQLEDKFLSQNPDRKYFWPRWDDNDTKDVAEGIVPEDKIKEMNEIRLEQDKNDIQLTKDLKTMPKGDSVSELYEQLTYARDKAKSDAEVDAINKKYHEQSNAIWKAQDAVRKQTAKNLKKLFKENPEARDKVEQIYYAARLNHSLLKKQKGKDKVSITPAEMKGMKSDEQLREMFVKKRAASYKSEGLAKKLLGDFADKGDEGKSFALTTVNEKTKKMIIDKMVKNHDMTEHGGFGFKIHNIFQVSDAEYHKDFKRIEKEIGNTIFSYHGTSFSSGAKIARGGFKITRPKAGRMIGDGIYGAEHSSKSLQYMNEYGFSRDPGSRGTIFVCKNALGKVKTLTSAEVGSRTICNAILQNDNYDTVRAEKGTGGLRNREWNCKDPNQFIPVYWIDAEITSRNDTENELFK